MSYLQTSLKSYYKNSHNLTIIIIPFLISLIISLALFISLYIFSLLSFYYLSNCSFNNLYFSYSSLFYFSSSSYYCFKLSSIYIFGSTFINVSKNFLSFSIISNIFGLFYSFNINGYCNIYLAVIRFYK